MSTVVRLSIVGKTHQRSFRVFAQEKKSKRDGKFLEILGSVNPHLEESKQVVIKKDRIAFWQKQGAQLSPTVAYLVKNGKLPPRPKKDRGKKEAAPPSQAKPEETQAPESEKASEQTQSEITENKAVEAQPVQEPEVTTEEVKADEPQSNEPSTPTGDNSAIESVEKAEAEEQK